MLKLNTKTHLRVIVTTVTILCSYSHIFANVVPEKGKSDPDTLKPVDLNSVVVTANKTKVNRNNVPLTISVIELQELEASGQSALLPVLSLNVPGLFVTQKGVTGFGVADGAAGVVNIRGVGQGNKVLMLHNGQPQWAGIFGHAIPDLYITSDAQRVEVIRGPASLLYGSNAMGGVINVITKDPAKEGMLTRARFSYGSFATRKYMINNGYSKGNFSSFLSFNRDATDGHRIRSGFDITNGFAKLGYRINDNFRVSADIALSKIFNQNPGRADDPVIDNKMDILRGSAAILIENIHKYGSGAVHLFYNAGNHLINDGYKFGSAPRNYRFNSRDHNRGIMVYENFNLFDGNTFTIGFDYKNWGGNAWNSPVNGAGSTGNTQIIDKKVDEMAGYLVVQQEFFGNMTLNGGIRIEHNSVFGSAVVPQLGTSLRLFPDNVIKFTISKGYRSPNIRELYMFPPKNPDLMPENMINMELSFGQTFLNSTLSAELSLFYIDGWNMIQTVIINGMPKNLNTGLFQNKGLEIAASYRARHDLRFDANYSLLNTSQPMLAAPKHKLFTSAVFTPGHFTFNLNAQHISGLYLNTATKAQAMFTIVNARVSYKLNWNNFESRFFVNGDNITGTRYSINEGFPMPGVTILCGIEIFF